MFGLRVNRTVAFHASTRAATRSPRGTATTSPVSAFSRSRLAWVRALPIVHAGCCPMVMRRCRP